MDKKAKKAKLQVYDVKEPTLEEAQAFVEGYVEAVTFPNDDRLLMNENGKLLGLPLNVEATNLWRSHFTPENCLYGFNNMILGNCILIKSEIRREW